MGTDDVKMRLPKWRVVGFVGYAKYVAYLGTYDEFVGGSRGGSGKVKDRGVKVG